MTQFMRSMGEILAADRIAHLEDDRARLTKQNMRLADSLREAKAEIVAMRQTPLSVDELREITRLRNLLWSVDVNPDSGALDPGGYLRITDEAVPPPDDGPFGYEAIGGDIEDD